VVTRQVAAAPTPVPPMEAYIELTPGSGSGMQVEHRHPGERDLVVEFSMCRSHGRSLWGAAPAGLIGEVPDEWVVHVGDAQLAAWEAIGEDPKHAELTVLTACRVWRFAEERRHCSKTAAGSGRSGVIPRSRGFVTPLGNAAATRHAASTPRRFASSWRSFERGLPRRAAAPRAPSAAWPAVLPI